MRGAGEEIESGMPPSVWPEHMGGWECRSWMWGSRSGEKIELVWIVLAQRCLLDLDVGMLVGSQEGKMLRVQGRSPSWRQKDEGHGGI